MKRTASVIIEVIALLFVAGLVAAVAIPDYRLDRPEVQHKAMIASLKTVRSAIDRFWGDHDATYPSIDALRKLGPEGNANRTRTSFATYLHRTPDNPYTNGNRIGMLSDPVGSSDWAYDPDTGVFKANDSTESRAL